jgi:phosphoribosylamine--glycine ligase
MKILIIGNGGREHALAWKMAQSPQVTKVFVAPGNGGTALEEKVENIDIAATEIQKLLEFAQAQEITFTVVGPEVPLVLGIVDLFSKAGLRCFGPTKNAAQLEGSKRFAKEFMSRHHIPTADYHVFNDPAKAAAYLEKCQFPIVIKADGLAAGKGVVIVENQSHAHCVINHFMSEKTLGDAGSQIVIEQFLTGEEASFIVMVDGENYVEFATSQDHKTRDDGDQGPNTGGMGAYSPAPVITPELRAKVLREVIEPTIKGFKKDGITYRGFLYAGLMISDENELNVLEYNCRLGDPEAQVLLFRLESDLYALCEAAFAGKLNEFDIQFKSQPALGVVLASQGYPDKYPTGEVIEGIPEEELIDGKVFHAGTKLQDDTILTNGGRVLCAVAQGDTLAQAQTLAYELADRISWDSKFCRRDIGDKGLR